VIPAARSAPGGEDGEETNSDSRRRDVLRGVLGVAGAVQTNSFHRALALESSMAWLADVVDTVKERVTEH
jgi:hypothetical protein